MTHDESRLARWQVGVVVLAGAAAIAAAGLGLGLDVMEVDAAQYAAIARHMSGAGGWLELTDRGVPFLNKPPLLFWASAAAFRLLGISNLAYRLPSLLVFLVGIYSTYRLGRETMDARAGRLSALVLATCQGAFLMVFDVRTDTMLVGWVAFSLWRAARFLERPGVANAVLLGLGLGAGMLTKGVIGLAIPLLGVLADTAGRRAWRRLLAPAWLLVALVAGILLVPMVIGLYLQHGAEGPRFLFWTQSFGRIFDENIWGDAHGPLFFVPQLLWTFLPWTLFLGLALIDRFRELATSRFRIPPGREALTLGAFALGFLGISLSRSKLPHYVYVTLPAAAVITGGWLATRLSGFRPPAALRAAQSGILALMGVFIVALVWWAFPLPGAPLLALPFGLGVWLAFRSRQGVRSAAAGSLLSIATANLVLMGSVYPRLLEYQATAAAGRVVADRAEEEAPLIVYRGGGHALDFYARRVAVPVPDPDRLAAALETGPAWIYTDSTGAREIANLGFEASVEGRFDDFHVSKLTLAFLDPATRAAVVSHRVLVRVRPAIRSRR